MRTEHDTLVLPPVIAAARLRAPRHRRKSRDLENNYLAEKPVSHGKRKRNRPGARPGNLNAMTHGACTAEHRAFRAYIHFLVSSARHTLALRRLAVQMRKRRS